MFFIQHKKQLNLKEQPSLDLAVSLQKRQKKDAPMILNISLYFFHSFILYINDQNLLSYPFLEAMRIMVFLIRDTDMFFC